MDDISKRMGELAKPIEKQIMMCDSREELLMMACVMLQRTKEILDQELTIEGRKKMFEDFV